MLSSQAMSDFREICYRCDRSKKTCICNLVRPFETRPVFAVLAHPKEARNRIGTARVVRLCVSNSLVIRGTGEDFDANPVLQHLLRTPELDPFVLFPGAGSREVSSLKSDPGKRLLIFVVDGTWDHAKNMVLRSSTLRALPRVAFVPVTPSNYRIRKQPNEICLSTVEAVHRVLSILEPSGTHDNLIEVFDWMVETQIRYREDAKAAGQCRQRSDTHSG